MSGKKKTVEEQNAELKRLRRWRVKPDKDLRIGPVIKQVMKQTAKKRGT